MRSMLRNSIVVRERPGERAREGGHLAMMGERETFGAPRKFDSPAGGRFDPPADPPGARICPHVGMVTVRFSRRRENSRLERCHLPMVREREIFAPARNFDPRADPLRVRPSRGRSRGRSLTMQMTGLVDARIVQHAALLPSDSTTIYNLTRLSDRPRTRAPGRPWQMRNMLRNSMVGER